jgi:hypothetical protein
MPSYRADSPHLPLALYIRAGAPCINRRRFLARPALKILVTALVTATGNRWEWRGLAHKIRAIFRRHNNKLALRAGLHTVRP